MSKLADELNAAFYKDECERLKFENQVLRRACIHPDHVDDYILARKRIEKLETKIKQLEGDK